jgi:threonine dehydrogenase-like Zn-dependent dehydrogenase
MRAAILHGGRARVGEFPDPTPIKGQVLVRTLRCGLCASDAYFPRSGPTIAARSQKHRGPYAGPIS